MYVSKSLWMFWFRPKSFYLIKYIVHKIQSKLELFNCKKKLLCNINMHCFTNIESAMEKKYNMGSAKECTINFLPVVITSWNFRIIVSRYWSSEISQECLDLKIFIFCPNVEAFWHPDWVQPDIFRYLLYQLLEAGRQGFM